MRLFGNTNVVTVAALLYRVDWKAVKAMLCFLRGVPEQVRELQLNDVDVSITNRINIACHGT